MNRVLVTGATGCVGTAAVTALRRAGWTVRGLARGPAPAGWPGDELVRAAVEDAAAVRAAADGCSAVLHLAGWVHRVPRSAEDVRALRASIVDGTRHVVDAAGDRRLVHASTVAVYGAFPGEPIDESAPLAPDTPYGEAKREAEDLVRARSPGATVLRIALVYGPGDRGNVAALLRAVDRRLAVTVGRGENRKSVVYVENLADRMALLAGRELPGAFIAADEAPTQRELVAALARALGRRSPLALPRAPLLLAGKLLDAATGGAWADRVRKLAAATEFRGAALDRALGYTPRVSLEEGLRRTVLAYRSGR